MKKSTATILVSLASIVGATRLADFMDNANTSIAIVCVSIFGVLYGLSLKQNHD